MKSIEAAARSMTLGFIADLGAILLRNSNPERPNSVPEQPARFCGKIESSGNTIDGTPYDIGRRAPGKNAESG
jgi:hypothetical protein